MRTWLRKRKIERLIAQRQTLRKLIRTPAPGNPTVRYYRKKHDLERHYRAAGQKLWDLGVLGGQDWLDAPLGLDITAMDVTMADIRQAMGRKEDSPEEYLKAEGHYKGPGARIDFRMVDGKMQMYRNGVEDGDLFDKSALLGPYDEDGRQISNG